MYLYEFKTPYYHLRKKGQSFGSRENSVENKKIDIETDLDFK